MKKRIAKPIRSLFAAILVALLAALLICPSPVLAQRDDGLQWLWGLGGKGLGAIDAIRKYGKDLGGQADDIAKGRDHPQIKRARENRKRVLNVLCHLNLAYYDEHSKTYNFYASREQREKLEGYYQHLRKTGAFKNFSKYHEDDSGEHSGTFWNNLVNQKVAPSRVEQYQQGQFSNFERIHNALLGHDKYGEAAGWTGDRGIDVVYQEMKTTVSTGVEAMILSLDAVTLGQSTIGRKWLEDSAKSVKIIKENPTGAAMGYLKKRITQDIGLYRQNVVDKMKSRLITAMGKENYDKVMSNYTQYKTEEDRLNAFMKDMFNETKDKRFLGVSNALNKITPEGLANTLEGSLKKTVLDHIGSQRRTATGKDKTAKTGKKDKKGKDVTRIETVVGKDPKKPQIGDLPELGADKDDKLTRGQRELVTIIEQMDRVSTDKYGPDWWSEGRGSTQYLTRFANLVRENLEKDGILDAHNEDHIAAMSRLLATAVVHGHNSRDYQSELDDYMKLRRTALEQTNVGACEPDSKAERLANAFRDKGFLLRDAGNKDQAIKHLMQSLEFCASEEVERALAALQKGAGPAEGVYEGQVSYKATATGKDGPPIHSMTGTIRLELSRGQVSGRITARGSLWTDNRGAQIVNITISNASVRDKHLGGQITGKSTHEAVEVREGSGPRVVCPPGIISNCIEGALVGPPPGVLDAFTNLVGAALSNYSFQGSITGVIDGPGARGSFQGNGTRAGDPIRILGSWQAVRQ